MRCNPTRSASAPTQWLPAHLKPQVRGREGREASEAAYLRFIFHYIIPFRFARCLRPIRAAASVENLCEDMRLVDSDGSH